MKLDRKLVILATTSVLLTLIVIIGIRMVIAKDMAPHYHANFAVFVDGQRLKFEGPTFYEETISCSLDGSIDPKTRVHMHNYVGDVIHVHDTLVTWSDFFVNLRYGLSDKALALDDKVLVDGADGKKLSFILNGQTEQTIASRVINSEDALLISYGLVDHKALEKQYSQIDKSAHRYNLEADPAACSGSHKLDVKERFKRATSVN